MSKGAKGAAASASAAAAAAGGGSAAEAPLLAAIKLAQDKPLQGRKDGLAALNTMLSTGGWAGATVNASASASKVLLPLLKDGQSFVNQFPAVNEENVAWWLPVYSSLFGDAAHFAWLQKVGLAEPQLPLYVTLLRLMLHPSHKVRVPTLATVSTLLAGKQAHTAQLAGVLLRTFQVLVNSKNAAALSAPNGSALWSRALLTIAAHPVPALMPLALLLAHDSLLLNADARSWRSANSTFDALLTAWSSSQNAVEREAADKAAEGAAAAAVAARTPAAAKRRARNVPIQVRDNLRGTVLAQLPAIEKLLFSNEALLPAVGTLAPAPVVPAAASPAGANAAAQAAAQAAAIAAATAGTVPEVDEETRSERQRASAVGLLLSLFRVFPQPSLSSLLSPVLSLLSHPDFARLSDADVAVFRTPEGSLCDYQADGTFRAVVVESKVKRPADWTEKDEELERRAAEKRAKEAAAAKKPVGAAGGKPGAKAAPLTGQAKVEAERDAKLAAQSALRAKLIAAKRQVEPVLSFFGLLAQRLPSLLHEHVLPSLLPQLYTLFANEIVRPAALATHSQLLVSLDTHVASIGDRIPLAVQAVKLHGAKAFADLHQKRMIARMLFELRAAARRRAFSSQTFLFVFPIVEATVLHSSDPSDSGLDKAAAATTEDDEDTSGVELNKRGAQKVKNLEAEDEDEEGEDEEENFDEKEDDEEKKSDARDEEKSASAQEEKASELGDLERPLGAGLQLSLASASDVLDLHCVPQLHEAPQAGKSVTPFPVASMYSSLLHLIGHVNTLYKPTLAALLQLSSGSGIRPEQTLPLLSVEGVLSPNESLRGCALQAAEELNCFAPAAVAAGLSEEDAKHFELFTQRMWIACHDSKSDVSERAATIWQRFGLSIGPQYLEGLIQLLTSQDAVTRTAVGSAIASAIQQHPAVAQQTLQRMTALFIASPDEAISATQSGLRQGTEYIYRWHTRTGVAQAIGACTDSITSAAVLTELFEFFIAHGLRDVNDRVWEECLSAALRIINQHGKTYMSTLLPMLEGVLQRDQSRNAARAAAAAAASSKGKKGAAAAAPVYEPESEEEEFANDRLREGVILAMGTLARHMEPDNPSLVGVVDSLVEALQTPSHSVQKSAAECLAPLMPFESVSANASKWIDLLLLRLHTADEYGVRKGASFGLAGMIKGLKLASLKKYNILEQLSTMVQDKNSMRSRQGAMFAYERLFFELGNRFEPYVGQILPFLLASYGDPNIEVREATQAASRVIMAHLTAHGIKLAMPIVLSGLETKEWRTKLESIGLLSAMAYCSPAQLSACLPMIVPRLLEVMADPNAKVQTASKNALTQIASVIKNPEILSLAPVLLAALTDPAVHTKKALQDLMRTSFVHSVDPPSLALIVPILRKGLVGRTAITKKMSAQVVGSMCSLIGDVKDILPYASTLLKYLKAALVDPNPEVRAVAARALAALYHGIEAQNLEGFVELRDWLLETLRSDDTTPTIRSGCAQGLAQLLAVQGLEATSQLLPSLFGETKSDIPVVREGFYSVFGFCCEAFGSTFSIFVADVLPVIVAGLADEIGLVRESALAAGQSLVLNFASTKTELLLPALEDGIISSDWRIRLSSVQLLGVMLLRLAGCSMKIIVGAAAHQEEDDEKGQAAICTREQENHIESVLGTDRRNRLLSTVYLMRCDVVPAVSDLAFRVWKSIVSNSPRMLTTILPVLMSLIISDLASSKDERQQAAGRSLGELISKMGDYILAEIVPILQARLKSDDRFTRQGVCLGLSEVMSSSRKADLASYMADLVIHVRDALCDPEEIVRKAAGTCFSTLLRAVGRRAVDDIVPALLWQLDEEEGDAYKSGLVLEGIKMILSINSADVLPFLIPALIKPPLSMFHAKALAFLSGNFTKGFIRYVESVTQAMLDGLGRAKPEEMDEMRVACSQVVLCVSQDCVSIFCNVLEETSTTNKNPAVRAAVAHLISAFTSNTRTSYDSQLPLLLQILLRLFVEEGPLLQAAWDALDAMLKSVPEERQARHIAFVRSVLKDISVDQYTLEKRASIPAFDLKNGIRPLLPMFQHGLMHGSAALRVEAADGLSDLVTLTSESALSPFVIKITGPLIRIVGDRFPATVKQAILNTLYLLLLKVNKHMRPFLPQLQTTMMKSLTDPAAPVRNRAGLALAELITEPKRAATVLNELTGVVSSDAAGAVKTSCLQAMVGICSSKALAGTLPPEVLSKCIELGVAYCGDAEKESIRRECSRLIAVNAQHLPEAELVALIDAKLLQKPCSAWVERDGVMSALQACIRTCGAKIEPVRDAITKLALAGLRDAHNDVLCAAILLTGELLVHAAKLNDLAAVAALSSALIPLVQSEVAQVRQEAVSRFQLLGEASAEASASVYDAVVPGLVSRAQDPNGNVRQSVVGATHCLFQFHRSGDDAFERAERLVGSYHARAMKKNANDATAMLLFTKKSVARAKVQPVADELWASTRVGESLADPNAAVSDAESDYDDEDDD